MIDIYYDTKNHILRNKLNIADNEKLKEVENHYFYSSFRNLKNDFSFDPEYIPNLHYNFFKDLYDWAGNYRLIDIEKEEMALNGLSIRYYPFDEINKNVNDTLLSIKRIKLNDLTYEEKVNYLTDVIAKLWLIHPFRECNTRTLVSFIYQYCNASSIDFNANLLFTNIDYFRRSLVASTFQDELLLKHPDKSYTLKIMRDALKNN
jgi:cell filamentation protein